MIKNVHQMSIVDIDLFNVINELIENNNSEEFKNLLKHPIYTPNENKNWAIRYAATLNKYEIVKLLLNDSRVNPSVEQDIAIIKAIQNNNIETVKLLIKYKKIDLSSHIIHSFNQNNIEMALLLFVDMKIKKDLKKHDINLFNKLNKLDIKNEVLSF